MSILECVDLTSTTVAGRFLDWIGHFYAIRKNMSYAANACNAGRHGTCLGSEHSFAYLGNRNLLGYCMRRSKLVSQVIFFVVGAAFGSIFLALVHAMNRRCT